MIWALPASFGMYSFKKRKCRNPKNNPTEARWISDYFDHIFWFFLLVVEGVLCWNLHDILPGTLRIHTSLCLIGLGDVIPRSSQESESYQEKTPCVQVLVACTTQNPSRPSLLISRFGTTSLISHGKSADPSKYDSTPFEGLRKVRWAACQVVTRCLIKPQLPLLSVLSVYMTLWLYDLSVFRSFGHFSFAELSAALFFPFHGIDTFQPGTRQKARATLQAQGWRKDSE